MAKKKVTLTLDSENLKELRGFVGARSLSATVDAAVKTYLSRPLHLRAVDEWLREMERKHGPIPLQTLEWATKLVGKWETDRGDDRE